jgi:murein DD-endopeptidase MepM/ murein hydrolase activator NlpD
MYDAQIGRWHVPDPQSEKNTNYTPFRFCFNNPVNVTDILGHIEMPLKGTDIFYTQIHKQVSYRHYVRDMPSLGHQGSYYNFAFRQTGMGIKSEAHKQAGENGMLVTVTSEWFRLRNVGSSPHIGIDFRAPKPESVYSLGDGKVVSKGYSKGTGNYLTIEYSNGDRVRFMHLSKYSNDIKIGDEVYEGQIIAMTGNSGYTKGGKHHPYHLHVDAVNANGEMINPLEMNYGSVTNEEFFTTYQGNYLKLKC